MSTPPPRGGSARARRGNGRSVLGDVAKLAGVSTATVSRVYNDPGKVSADVQQRVRDAARALNWIPNAAGRALASTRTHITGAIIPTLDDQVFASQVAGMQTRGRLYELLDYEAYNAFDDGIFTYTGR